MTSTNHLRILISNDDGIYAPGLKILEKIARALTKDVWIVAPAQEQSGAAHSLTLNHPLRPKKIGPKKFSVDGTPTDCVLMAMKELIHGRLPDLVLSGVNAGANLADDVTYSGTVAAAMEAASLDVPAIALSQATTTGYPIKWETALTHAPKIIKALIETKWQKNILININFPDVIANSIKGACVTTQGLRPAYKSLIKAIDPRGLPYYWVGPAPNISQGDDHTDLAAINRDQISITPLHLDLTHTETFKKLASIFNDV